MVHRTRPGSTGSDGTAIPLAPAVVADAGEQLVACTALPDAARAGRASGNDPASTAPSPHHGRLTTPG
jgi:hypothetical protein